ncbi:MAG: TetR/AcrR family transcriptional regulator [Acidihalobacter sp.]|uniref:TetR/AcrR family transcriptional regulator n=1 Tax=Acidihalobacter sp. TaxID=1872108 RepID=UPI00307F8E9B
MATKHSPLPIAQGTDLRNRLIGEAIAILEHEGLEALTLRGVARAAGVSHMAPYRHFTDKEALLAAVAETGFRELSADMGGAASKTATAKERMRAIGMAYLRFARRRPGLYRLMFGPVQPDETRFPKLAEASRATFAHCAEAVAERTASTEQANAGAQEALPLAAWALVHGLSSLLIDGHFGTQRSPEDEDRRIGEVMALFGRIFQPHSAS